MSTIPSDDEQLRTEIRQRYARLARQAPGQGPAQEGCCSSGCCPTREGARVSSDLYSEAETANLPTGAVLASLGCGNPTALASLRSGERVLDLGSGGGIDVLLSARRVGPTGFVYGLDMTDAMLELAERNRIEAGVGHVRFLKGVIEEIPLPASAVDVVISNCVINLSPDKARVLREAYRVLVPGGRLAVSDVIFQGTFPPAIRRDLEAWAGCIAGALEEETYRQFLAQAGFGEISIEVTRRYTLEAIAESGGGSALAALAEDECAGIAGRFVSAFIRAHKPLSLVRS
jgi:ubiquinone/menaquinone biosynthesis C-methylase UbiE